MMAAYHYELMLSFLFALRRWFIQCQNHIKIMENTALEFENNAQELLQQKN